MISLLADRRPALGADSLHLWRADAAALERVGPCLRPEEAPRAQRDPGWARRRSLLRRLLSVYAGLDARELELVAGPKGKPALAGHADLHFSMSGSQGCLLVAVARRPVGVDLEAVRPVEGARAIAGRCFSDVELALLEAEAQAQARMRRFFGIWVQKEAHLKRIGVGLSGLGDLRDPAWQRGSWVEPVPCGHGFVGAVSLERAPEECWFGQVARAGTAEFSGPLSTGFDYNETVPSHGAEEVRWIGP